MNLFLDTNVIVGYCIELDYWHYYALKIMKNEDIFWSNTTKEETEEKLNELMVTYSNFFIEIGDYLIHPIITEKEFINIVKSIEKFKMPFKQENLAKIIWSNGGWFNYTNSNEIISELNSINNSMKKTIFKNFNYCIDKLYLHNRKYNPKNDFLVKKIRKIKRRK